MSLAREVELSTIDGLPRLVQRPVLPAELGPSIYTMEDQEICDSTVALPHTDPASVLRVDSVHVIDAEILPGSAGTTTLSLLGALGGDAATLLTFEAATSQLTLDRRNSGNTAFHEKFASAESAPPCPPLRMACSGSV